MARTWYGNAMNRIAENAKDAEIAVGTGATEFFYSDRHAYEVTAVKDQKHVTIREYDHKLKGEAFSNEWELVSNPENPEIDLVKRGENWYTAVTCTPEQAKEIYEGTDFEAKLWACHAGFDLQAIIAKGKAATKYHKRNIRFGCASYYYDYEF